MLQEIKCSVNQTHGVGGGGMTSTLAELLHPSKGVQNPIICSGGGDDKHTREVGWGGMIRTPAEVLHPSQGVQNPINLFWVGGWGGMISTPAQLSSNEGNSLHMPNVRLCKLLRTCFRRKHLVVPPFLPQNKQSFPKHTPNFALGQRGQVSAHARREALQAAMKARGRMGADSCPSVQEPSTRRCLGAARGMWLRFQRS